MSIKKFKISVILSVIIIFFALAASAGGVFFTYLYQDNDIIKAAWFGNDLVTLFIAVPMMIVSLLFTVRGSKKALLIWMGTLWYMVYNYMFYLYGAAFNVFFLLYVMLFTLSTYALIFALIKVDEEDISQKFSERTPVKWISGYMIFFATLLGVLWTVMSVSFIFTGQVPEDIIKTGHVTGIVYATDLSLLIPGLFLSAVLLWMRKPWGYVLSAIVLVKSTTYSLVLIVMSVVSYVKIGKGDSMTLLWSILSFFCLLSLLSLLGNMSKDRK